MSTSIGAGTPPKQSESHELGPIDLAGSDVFERIRGAGRGLVTVMTEEFESGAFRLGFNSQRVEELSPDVDPVSSLADDLSAAGASADGLGAFALFSGAVAELQNGLPPRGDDGPTSITVGDLSSLHRLSTPAPVVLSCPAGSVSPEVVAKVLSIKPAPTTPEAFTGWSPLVDDDTFRAVLGRAKSFIGPKLREISLVRFFEATLLATGPTEAAIYRSLKRVYPDGRFGVRSDLKATPMNPHRWLAAVGPDLVGNEATSAQQLLATLNAHYQPIGQERKMLQRLQRKLEPQSRELFGGLAGWVSPVANAQMLPLRAFVSGVGTAAYFGVSAALTAETDIDDAVRTSHLLVAELEAALKSDPAKPLSA